MNSFDAKLMKEQKDIQGGSANSSFSGQQLYKTSGNVNLMSDSHGHQGDQFTTLNQEQLHIITPQKQKEGKNYQFPDLTEINELNEKIDVTNQEDNLTQPTRQ